jgi:signal transduction histidine kinase
VWLLLFSAMAIASPIRNTQSTLFLSAMALFQVLEPRAAWFSTKAGSYTAISIKLLLGYLLIGYTDAINSSYFPILLVPVVAAATTRGALATAFFTMLACAAYLSFLLFLGPSDGGRYLLDWGELFLRIIFLPIVGYLTYTMAEANRNEAHRYQAVAEQLASANRNLQDAEAAVRRSERLAALGQLTAGMAHELRNPLGTIRASAELLSRNLDGKDAVSAELAGFITTEADRANSLITRFLDFARPQPLRKERADITLVLDRAVNQLERAKPAWDVSVYKNYSPEVPLLDIDGELMERVFYNLLLNAAQASPAGSAITIKTRLQDGEAEIAIIDRGSGIEKSQLENIFNPFFTTKPDGVGLGLAIVSKILDAHGGRIQAESEPGTGSVFRVLLPVVSGASGTETSSSLRLRGR